MTAPETTAPIVASADLVPGRRYRVELEDCCVTADLVGTFIELDPEDDPEDDTRCTRRFDFGEVTGGLIYEVTE